MNSKNYLILAVFLFVTWGGFMVFFYLKADEITRDPCSICAERMGEQVICNSGGSIPVNRVYYPNGSIYEDRGDIKFVEHPVEIVNLSEIINITVDD